MLFITSFYQEKFDVWRQYKGKIIIFKNKIIIDFCYFDFILYFYLCVIFVLLINLYSREKLK